MQQQSNVEERKYEDLKTSAGWGAVRLIFLLLFLELQTVIGEGSSEFSPFQNFLSSLSSLPSCHSTDWVAN